MTSFSLLSFIALIIELKSNFRYPHLAVHKLCAAHVSYNCTLSGIMSKNYIAIVRTLQLTPNKWYEKIFLYDINQQNAPFLK